MYIGGQLHYRHSLTRLYLSNRGLKTLKTLKTNCCPRKTDRSSGFARLLITDLQSSPWSRLIHYLQLPQSVPNVTKHTRWRCRGAEVRIRAHVLHLQNEAAVLTELHIEADKFFRSSVISKRRAIDTRSDLIFEPRPAS